MKATEFHVPKTIIAGTVMLAIIWTSAIRSCHAQSIGLMVGFSENGIIHTGIQLQNTTGKFGIYAKSITDETDGNRQTFNSYDSNLRHLSGFSAGLSYQVGTAHPLWLSAGMGRIKCSSYAGSKFDDKCQVIGEAYATVQLTKWCDCFFGINTYPMILSGLALKICKQ